MKYSDEQLKSMADEFIEAEKAGDMRCLQLLTILQMFTGLSNADIHARIIAFSNLKTEN